MKSFIFKSSYVLQEINVQAESTDLTDEEKAQFDAILVPVTKLYNFIKYSASLIATIMLFGSGVLYMVSGSDIRKREMGKNTATFTIIGLSIIWAAPYIVSLMIA